MSEDAATNRKVYGRGLFDGLRMAGVINPGEFMNEAKLQKAEQGINGMAKKVLDAVPIQEPWSKNQIVAEIRRAGSNAGVDVIESCLNNLRGRSLISEPSRGMFQRITAKPRVHLVQVEPQTTLRSALEMAVSKSSKKEHEVVITCAADMLPANLMGAAKKDPLESMAELAQMARDLAGTAQKLAASIETAALEAEERMEQIRRDTDKLRQLQALLKDIGQ